MKKIFITGASASGKSTLCEEFVSRELQAFDIEKLPGVCAWLNKSSGDVAKYRPGVGEEWFAKNDWICDFGKINEKINSYVDSEVVYVFGICTNQYSFLNEFDQIFLLHIDDETMKYRLTNRTTNHFGKDPKEQGGRVRFKNIYINKMLKLDAIPLDATKPIKDIADIIVEKINTD